ncbi:uncharacterized protein LOC111400318 [Olea europaea var. sylvestris]|uniref:uncharacterized protein LOC111400318 n=1 Tax=Olea europaea var. sylvestris TaxID=158386 RepID=UPI000C1CF85A|nr:uncharacterized protein LOC111400318 [Olea europaea var. sylvestris]
MVVSQHLSVDGSLSILTRSTVDHFLAVKRILRYVKGTIHFGISFRPSSSPGALVAYSDADWVGCPDTRRLTSISWSAKKQPSVSRSSCESEYRALTSTAVELVWLTHLLHDLKTLSLRGDVGNNTVIDDITPQSKSSHHVNDRHVIVGANFA